jgi:hypothetical protein
MKISEDIKIGDVVISSLFRYTLLNTVEKIEGNFVYYKEGCGLIEECFSIDIPKKLVAKVNNLHRMKSHADRKYTKKELIIHVEELISSNGKLI